MARINNEKCCGGTRDSTNGDVCYVLRSQEVRTGWDIAIDTFYSDGTATLTKGATILPILPFRTMLGTKKYMDDFDFYEQPTDVSQNLEWNPGLTINTNTRLDPSIITSVNNHFEINVSRNELSNYSRFGDVQLYTGPFNAYWGNQLDIKAYVLEPKMMVDHANTIDYITIAYNARVDMKGKFAPYNVSQGKKNKFKTIYWTVPFIVRFPITKTDLRASNNLKVKHFYWSYGVDTSKQYGAITSLNGLGGTIATKSYDFQIIPHARIIERFSNNISVSLPLSYGCKTDLFSDRDRSQTLVCSALGHYDENKKQLRSDVILSRLDLSTSYGFKSPTESVFIKGKNDTELIHMVSKISIAVNSTNLGVVVCREPVRTTAKNDGYMIVKIVELAAFNVATNYSKFTKSAAATIVPYSTGFGISYLSQHSSYYAKVLNYPSSISSNKECTGSTNSLPSNTSILITISIKPSLSVKGYTPLANSSTYYPHTQRNSEVYLDIEEYFNQTNDIYFRPLTISSASIDIPKLYSDVQSKNYYLPTETLESHTTGLGTDLYTIYDDNELDPGDYFHIPYITINKNPIVRPTKSDTINISGTIQPEYWVNPEFAESEAETGNLGVQIIVSLLNCSGLYTVGDISDSGAWDSSARPAAVYDGGVIHGGIPLDPARTRTDISYTYHGTEAGYISQQPPHGTNAAGETRFGGSYTLVLENDCDVQLTYNSFDILAGSNNNGVVTVHPVCWKYNQSGLFNMYLNLLLNLDNITDDSGNSFTNGSFTMSNCLLTATLKNNYGDIISRFEERPFTISPPSASGVITSTVGYKTYTSGYLFSLYRDVSPTSSTFSTVENITYHFYDMSEGETSTYRNGPSFYIENSNNGGVADIDLSFDPDMGLQKGDFVYMSYVPRVHGVRALPGTIETTHEVTSVVGHKFSPSDIAVSFSGAAGWEDVTTSVQNGTLLFYGSLSELNVRVTFALDHEVWPGRADLTDDQIYPYIKNMYLFAVKGAHRPSSKVINSYGNSIPVVYKEIPPNTAVPLTYPNHTIAFGDRLKLVYNNILSQIPSQTVVETPGDTTLTSFIAGVYNLEIAIPDPGEYTLYVIIEDEFDQRSCFCATNITSTDVTSYKIPFST